ncbi:MAG: hypothetical protein HY858_13920 [Candidatus Solibacter usitatus]|nr:hypothetical protein [Candidatus Solibacter usitatus]
MGCCLLLAAGLAAMSGAMQRPIPEQLPPQEPHEPGRLPNGKNQAEEILKADHAENLKDLGQMRKLMDSVEAEMKKYDRHVLSVKSLKDLEEIEKISRRVRGRMKRF